MAQTVWLPLIDEKRCSDCGLCVVACPAHALACSPSKAKVVNPDACTYCGQCELVCPEHAIQVPFQIVLCEQGGHAAGSVGM